MYKSHERQSMNAETETELHACQPFHSVKVWHLPVCPRVRHFTPKVLFLIGNELFEAGAINKLRGMNNYLPRLKKQANVMLNLEL